MSQSIMKNLTANVQQKEMALDAGALFLKPLLLTATALFLVGVYSMQSSIGVDLSADLLQEALERISQFIE